LAIERFGEDGWHELEDGGGSGTQYGHPEQTIYWSDYMVGYSESNQKITELTFVCLLDSGRYDVDFRGTQRNIFGLGASIGKNTLTRFGIEPSQLVFPSHYISKDDFEDEYVNWIIDHLVFVMLDQLIVLVMIRKQVFAYILIIMIHLAQVKFLFILY
jgi:hypothetical protein